MATKGPRLECVECSEPPAVYSLVENDGVIVDCECEDLVSACQDALPYEIRVQDLPDRWQVVEEESDADDGQADPGPNQRLTEAGRDG